MNEPQHQPEADDYAAFYDTDGRPVRRGIELDPESFAEYAAYFPDTVPTGREAQQ